jgi:hypothetical protein
MNLAGSSTIVGLNAEYHERLARFLRSFQKSGEIGGPPQGLTVERIVEILIRSAEGARHDAKAQGEGVRVGLVRQGADDGQFQQANKEFVTSNTLYV